MATLVYLLAVILAMSVTLLATGIWVLRKKPGVTCQVLGVLAIIFGTLLLLALIVTVPLIATTST